MVSSTQPVAFPARQTSPERLIWALGGLVLVISAVLSAMAVPALAESQSWPFLTSNAADLVPTARSTGAALVPPADALEEAAAEAASVASLPERTGTAPTEGDATLFAAVVEAAASAASASAAAEAPAPTTTAPSVAAPAATPIAQPTAVATPVATPIATPIATPTPVATAAPTPQPTPQPASSTPAPLATFSERAAGLFLAMNEERVATGLAPLVASAAASEIAMHRALDMQQNDYFAHVSPSGENWLALVNAAGIPLTAGGENLAKISGDVEHSVIVAITKLMESPTHAANILGAHYDSVGVAAVTDERGVTIFVTIFLG